MQSSLHLTPFKSHLSGCTNISINFPPTSSFPPNEVVKSRVWTAVQYKHIQCYERALKLQDGAQKVQLDWKRFVTKSSWLRPMDRECKLVFSWRGEGEDTLMRYQINGKWGWGDNSVWYLNIFAYKIWEFYNDIPWKLLKVFGGTSLFNLAFPIKNSQNFPKLGISFNNYSYFSKKISRKYSLGFINFFFGKFLHKMIALKKVLNCPQLFPKLRNNIIFPNMYIKCLQNPS